MGRFAVTYRIFAADAAEARARADGIALEQTVEIPRDIVPEGYVEDVILGKVEEVLRDGDQFRATISYHSDATGPDLPQILNVVFGNSSIQRGLKVIGLDPGDGLDTAGAVHGIAGLRTRLGQPNGALLAPVLKPMGQPPEALAALAYRCARAGAQIIKEDHGLSNQPAAPFRPRIAAIAEAVARANAETGGRSLYLPTLSGASGEAMENATFALQAGADGFVVMPGLYGFDLSVRLATLEPAPIIMAHPSFLGPYVLSPDTGFSHGMMFGLLQRLARVDISVFPNVGGRFGFTADECTEIRDACTLGAGIGRPIWPSPGGGMTPDRASDMIEMYGRDAVFLLGGSILRAGDDLDALVRGLVAQLGADTG